MYTGTVALHFSSLPETLQTTALPTSQTQISCMCGSQFGYLYSIMSSLWKKKSYTLFCCNILYFCTFIEVICHNNFNALEYVVQGDCGQFCRSWCWTPGDLLCSPPIMGQLSDYQHSNYLYSVPFCLALSTPGTSTLYTPILAINSTILCMIFTDYWLASYHLCALLKAQRYTNILTNNTILPLIHWKLNYMLTKYVLTACYFGMRTAMYNHTDQTSLGYGCM